MPLEVFTKTHLNRAHLVLRNASRLPSLWGMRELDQYLNTHEGELHHFVYGSRDGTPIDIPASSRHQGRSQKRFLEREFASGATFKIGDLEWRAPLFSALSRHFERQFGGTAVAKLFITPPTKKGFSAHFDHESVFVVQLTGTKLWRIFPRSVVNPKQSMARILTREELEQPSESTILEPGDVLYLPAGTPHAAECTDVSSMHVSIGLSPWTPTDVIQHAVNAISLTEPAMNAPLFTSEPYCSALLREAVDRCITALKTLSPDTLFEQFQRSCNAVRREASGMGLSNFCAITSLSENSLVSRNELKIVRKQMGEKAISLYISDASNVTDNPEKQPPYIELPAFVDEELTFLLGAREPTSISEIPGLLDVTSKVVLAKELLRHGVLYAE